MVILFLNSLPMIALYIFLEGSLVKKQSFNTFLCSYLQDAKFQCLWLTSQDLYTYSSDELFF